VLGEAEAFASMREFVRQFRISSREARSTGAEQIDAMNDRPGAGEIAPGPT